MAADSAHCWLDHVTPHTQVNLLLVENELGKFFDFESVLGPLGGNLVRAASAQEARQHVLTTDFAMILLDVSASALETAKLIRANPRSSGTPIIFLTAPDGSGFSVEEAFALGAVDCLATPVVPAILKGKVEFFVELHRSKQQLRAAERREIEATSQQQERTAELKQEKLFLEAVLENIEDGIVACDQHGMLTLFNRATKNLHGLPQESLPPEEWARHYDLFGADGKTPLSKDDVPLFRALAGEFVKDAEMVIAPTGGEPRTLLASGQPLYDAHGQKLGAVVSMHDITDRQKAEAAIAEVVHEQALRQSEERVRDVLESIGDGFLLLDSEWRITYMNAAAERINDQRREDYLGKNHWEVYPATVGTVIHREFLRCDAERVPVSFENYYEPWDRWFELDASPALGGSIAVYYRDVTATKLAAEALKGSEQRFRLLADTIPNLAWMARPDGHIFWYNRRWYDYTGTTPEAMEGWGWQDVHHPDELPKVLARWTESISTGQPFNMVFPIKGADGVFRPFLTLVNPFREPTGEILFWFGTNTDITEQKQSEERLARSAEIERHRAGLLTQVAESSRSINAVLSVESITRVLSEDARRILGTHVAITSTTRQSDCDQVVNAISLSEKYASQRGREVLPDGLSALVCQTNLPLRLTEAEVASHPEWRGNNDAPARSWLGVPLVGHGGRNLGIIQLSDKEAGDFTREDEAVLAQLAATASVGLENSRLYDSLREQDKRKDEFLATLAHELRNPLAPVRTGLEILKVAGDGEQAKTARDMMDPRLGQMVL